MIPFQILIIGPAWVGDMVMAQSLYLSLHQVHPACLIDVAAPAWSLPLLARMPQVRHGIELPIGHQQLGLGVRWRVARKLRNQAYDLAIVLPRSFKSALIPWFAGVPQRRGYRGEMRYGVINEMRPMDPSRLTQTVQRFVALGYPQDTPQPAPIAKPRLTVDRTNQQGLLAKLNLTTQRPIVALMPGAEYGPAKQWPVEYYRNLARRLVEVNNNVWILGSAKERTLGDQIALGLPAVSNLCGRTTLVDAVDLLALVHVAITNDSGLMHIAAATGVPVVAIYGSSTPDYTPPLTDRAQVIYHRLECSPCFARTCRYGHYNCLKGISVDEVLIAIKHIAK
ncbi:MAG: lipopolysaccharide heptosyltransferase II [Gammaproteobacteria bacterium]|nr:lipopolysaccharide heptosyltransferase II [Gammaproteobacteria bacterium]